MRTNELPKRTGYRRLWHDWLSAQQTLIFLSIALMVVSAVASAGYSKSVQLIIAAFENADHSVIYWAPIAIIILSSSKGASNYLQALASNLAFSRFEANLQKVMYKKLLTTDLGQLQLDTPASVSIRFSADIALIRLSLQAILDGLLAGMVILATVAVMLSIDWQISIVLVLVFTLAVAPVNVIGGKVRNITRESQANLSRMNSEIVEGLGGIRMARTYQLEDHLEQTAFGIFNRLLALKIDLTKWQARVSPVMEILTGLAIAVLLVIVSWRISRGTITPADFIGLLTGVSIIAQPARNIGVSFSTAAQGRVAIDRAFEILDSRDEINDHEGALSIERADGALSFENVAFKYPNGFEALQGLNIEIPAGFRVALVGRSGAGKSTVFNLIPRLFDATSGRILLDGVDIRDLTLESLRRQIAVVSQDSVLLAGTIAENIGFGRIGASDSDIRKAARAAAADGFIERTENGYDTRVTPSGGHFSGGEKQRLSIARAILRDAPILLLDEPTSALDAESEAAIRKALETLAEGRTTLVIAHRLATILDSDIILVMDQGKVVETGTHEELLEHKGIYAELYKLQFAGV